MRAGVVFGIVVAVGAVGCAKRLVRPPTEAYVELAGKKASYRQWAKAEDLCLQDPKLFQGDLDSMNQLLAVFLEKTSAGLDGAWGDEQIGVLEDGTVLLPQPLALEAASIEAAERSQCPWTGLAQAKELNTLAKKRLEQAPDLLKVAKARRALADWKAAHPALEQRSREQRCAAPSKQPVLFHAFEDEASRLEWRFCDGSKVVATPGQLPAYEPPPPPAPEPSTAKGKTKATKPPPKLPAPQVYLDLASKFPSGDVLRAPKVPKIVPVKQDDGAEEPAAP
jgi:hypothetical protein